MPNLSQLGRSALRVARFALGCNVFDWTVDQRMAFKLLDVFTSEGFNLIDTANVYPYWAQDRHGGESETIIGEWLRRRPGMRARIVIATKVGFDLGRNTGGLSRASILQEADKSLHRLNTDYIDLYQSHIDDVNRPIEERLDAYASLLQAGKIRAIGASNYCSERLKEALRISAEYSLPRYDSVQPEYNLYNRNGFEHNLAALCRREDLAVIPYCALASGFLTGKYRSEVEFLQTHRGQFVRQAWDTKTMFGPRGQNILASLNTIASETNATAAQVAIAWLLAHGVTAPAASATSVEQLKELLGGVSLQLSKPHLDLLNEASAS